MPTTLSRDLWIESPFAPTVSLGFLLTPTNYQDDGEGGISFWRFEIINERQVKVYQRATPNLTRMYCNCIYRVSYNN